MRFRRPDGLRRLDRELGRGFLPEPEGGRWQAPFRLPWAAIALSLACRIFQKLERPGRRKRPLGGRDRLVYRSIATQD